MAPSKTQGSEQQHPFLESDACCLRFAWHVSTFLDIAVMKQKKLPPFPLTGIVRVSDILPVLNCHKATLYRLIQAGRFPQPSKLGRSSCWRAETVLDWLNKNVPIVPAPVADAPRSIVTQ